MAKERDVEVKKGVAHELFKIVLWLTSVIVALAVGSSMIDGTLKIFSVPAAITAAAGWIVVLLTVLGAVLSLFEKKR